MQILGLMSRLRDEKIANTDEDGHWMLTRDLEELSLGALYNHGNYYLPLGDLQKLPLDTEWDRVYVESLQHFLERGDTEWERSLRSMYLGGKKEGNPI